MDDTFACPAASLVACVDEPQLVVLRQGNTHLRMLGRHSWLWAGRMTAFNQQMATILRPVHGVQAWSLREGS